MDSNGNDNQKEQKTRLNSLEVITDKCLGYHSEMFYAHVYMHACEFAWMSIGIYFAVLFPGHTHLLIPDKVFDIC